MDSILKDRQYLNKYFDKPKVLITVSVGTVTHRKNVTSSLIIITLFSSHLKK